VHREARQRSLASACTCEWGWRAEQQLAYYCFIFLVLAHYVLDPGSIITSRASVSYGPDGLVGEEEPTGHYQQRATASKLQIAGFPECRRSDQHI
jgi:hypothetical protein